MMLLKPMQDVSMKRQLMALLAVSGLMPWPLLIQNNWWAYIVATAAIVAALRLLLGEQWAKTAGLKLPPAHIPFVVIAFVAVAILSRTLLPLVYEMAGLKVNAPGIEQQAGFLFQALNEEILFRALLIGFFIYYVRSTSVLSLGAAFLFVAPHFLMYRFTNPMHLRFQCPRLQRCSLPVWR